MPIVADTPQLVSQLDTLSFSFSGAAYLRFEDDVALFLSWAQSGDDFVLATGEAAAWRPHALDRIQVFGDTWGDLIGSTLETAEFFCMAGDDERLVVAVRHETSAGRFWIAVGREDLVCCQDDLWVGVSCDPPNLADLMMLPAR